MTWDEARLVRDPYDAEAKRVKGLGGVQTVGKGIQDYLQLKD